MAYFQVWRLCPDIVENGPAWECVVECVENYGPKWHVRVWSMYGLVWPTMSKYSRVCFDMSLYGSICLRMARYGESGWVCSSLAEHERVWSSMGKYAREWSNFHLRDSVFEFRSLLFDIAVLDARFQFTFQMWHGHISFVTFIYNVSPFFKKLFSPFFQSPLLVHDSLPIAPRCFYLRPMTHVDQDIYSCIWLLISYTFFGSVVSYWGDFLNFLY